MKEQFADYETSRLLKELGFDESCLAFWDRNKDFVEPQQPVKNKDLVLFYSAPLWQQVKQWLWEKQQIYVRFEKAYSFQLFVFKIGYGELSRNDGVGFNSPMSAEIEGIKIAVKYLHSLIKK